MKLYIMKRDSLEFLKSNISVLYGKYYTEPTNKWIQDVCGEDPFIEYKGIPDFNLADLDSDSTPGEIDLKNCKILYEKLIFLSESQACDERLWAGLTHTIFYEYMRKRWGYGNGKKPKSEEKEAGAIRTRFFYKNAGRSGFYRNTLAKCWWVGHNTYDPQNTENHFEKLDIIGSNDLNSKISEIFYSFNFSSNPNILAAIVDTFREFKEEGKRLLVREHIRPALSYLNAVGGALVIDCLGREDITDILSDIITAIMQGDTPSLNFDNTLSEEIDVDIDYSDDSSSNEAVSANVFLGCKIKIRNIGGEEKFYKYDFNNGTFPTALNVFTGRKIGDNVIILGKPWEIVDISI